MLVLLLQTSHGVIRSGATPLGLDEDNNTIGQLLADTKKPGQARTFLYGHVMAGVLPATLRAAVGGAGFAPANQSRSNPLRGDTIGAG